MLKTIFVETVIQLIFQDLQMNRKFKRTFIWVWGKYDLKKKKKLLFIKDALNWSKVTEKNINNGTKYFYFK